MSSLNVGKVGNIRYGSIWINAADGSGTAKNILNIEDGSIELEEPGYASEVNMDNGVMGDDCQMDDRPTKFKLRIKVSAGTFAASEVNLAIQKGFSAGIRVLFGLLIKRPDYRDATAPTGKQKQLTNCRCPEGFKYGGKAGPGFDYYEAMIETLSPSRPDVAWDTLT